MGRGVPVLGRAVPEAGGGVPGLGGCPSLWGWQKYCPRLRTQACPTSGRYPKSRVSVTRSRMGGTYSSSAGRCWGRAVLSPRGASSSTHGWGGPPPSIRPPPILTSVSRKALMGKLGLVARSVMVGVRRVRPPHCTSRLGACTPLRSPRSPHASTWGGAPSSHHPLWGALSAPGSPQMGWMPGGMLKVPVPILGPVPMLSSSCPRPSVPVPIFIPVLVPVPSPSPSSALSPSLTSSPARLHPRPPPCPCPHPIPRAFIIVPVPVPSLVASQSPSWTSSPPLSPSQTLSALSSLFQSMSLSPATPVPIPLPVLVPIPSHPLLHPCPPPRPHPGSPGLTSSAISRRRGRMPSGTLKTPCLHGGVLTCAKDPSCRGGR